MNIESIKIFSKPSHLHEELEGEVNDYLSSRNGLEYHEVKHQVDISQSVLDGTSYTTILVKESTSLQ